MGKIVTLLIGWLIGPIKSLADFFLSGGGAVFVAISSFVGVFSLIYYEIKGFSDQLAPFLDDIIQGMSWLQDFGTSSFGDLLKYCCAADTLFTVFSSFLAVALSILSFIFVGILSTFVGLFFPLIVFKVVYFIKKNVFKI